MEARDEDAPDADNDFSLLMEAVDDLAEPKVGALLQGKVITNDAEGLVVGLGLKRDGFVPRADVEKSGEEYAAGDSIQAVIVSLQGKDGNFELSLFQARQNQDWLDAEALLESGELWVALVSGYNRGGLTVPFGGLRGFVPASHVSDLPRGVPENERQSRMARMVDQEIGLRVIEVDRRHRRLVFSQREAQREWRARRKAELMASLGEGQVVKGTVSGLRDFGAFVDLGGADGLIHVSELAWQRVEHPREVVRVGDEIEVMVIRVDAERNRIGLSLKRLQPDPWEHVEEQYSAGQEVVGRVTRLAPFGAFVELGGGLEGLLHTSEIPEGLSEHVKLNAALRLTVANVDATRQRIGLSLRGVSGEQPRVDEAAGDAQPDREPDDMDSPVESAAPAETTSDYDEGDADESDLLAVPDEAPEYDEYEGR